MVIELVVGMVLGLAIGFGLDALFGTRPIFLVVFALLGFAAGVRTMLRTAEEVQSGQRRGRADARGDQTDDGPTDEGGSDGGRAGGSGFNIHPMEQFEVHPLFGGDDGALVHPDQRHALDGADRGRVSLLMIAGSRGRALVPSRAQSIAETIYGFAHKMIEDVAGKQGLKYFPYIMTLFLFILFANLLALIPGSFASTSHIAVTAILALAVFITVTVIGFMKHGAALPEALLGGERADGGAADRAGGDRGDLLLRAAAQPLGPTCRQHDGRPRGAEGLRGLRRRARRRRRHPDPGDHRACTGSS